LGPVNKAEHRYQDPGVRQMF